MRKILSMLLAVAMVAGAAVSLSACKGADEGTTASSGTSGAESTASVESQADPVTPGAANQVILGSVTDLDANMMSGFTNSAANANVRLLVFESAATVVWTRDDGFVYNPQVVTEHDAVVNEDGTKTFTMKIANDLKYNDGSAISAKDFVFQALLTSSPQFGAVDGDNTANNTLVGFEGWNSGEAKTFTGIRLIDDSTFSVTVKAEELPYYYDVTFAAFYPYPISVIAPGCDVADDGEGAYVSGDFTSEVLAETVNKTGTGYRYMPKVTPGAYQIEAYNDSDKQITMTINPNFKGTYDGVKPSIERIVVKKVVAATSMDELAAGQVDMLDAEGEGAVIERGLDLVDEGKAEYVTYNRAGYGRIAFHCDFGPTQFKEVRQAITYCLDRDSFVKQFTGGYGSVVSGYYGLSQWEYQENKAVMEEKMNAYSYNLDKAKETLIAGGWTLNEQGGDFVEGTDTLRYKKLDDGTLMPCTIEWFSTPDDENAVAALIAQMLVPEVEKVGMKINRTTGDFGVMLEHLGRQPGGAYTGTPTYNMFNLGTGFVPILSPWYEYSADPQYDGLWNSNFIHDEELSKLAQEMKLTDAEDKEGWSAKWLAFNLKWNELMPDIPLYSNIYHVFYNPKIKNYNPNPLWEWGYEFVYTSVE